MITSFKNIAIIPARGGSKRLPKKNIKKLNGIPLIAHSINYAKNSGLFEAIVVTSDDDEILEIAHEFGAMTIKRPDELSGDMEPTSSALKHVLSLSNTIYDYVFLLQATNPLRPKNLVHEAFKTLVDSKKQSLFSVSRDEHKLGRIFNNQFEPFNYTFGQRSQDLVPLYFENGLLYISHSELILKGIIFNSESFPFVVDHPFAKVDIDHEIDFKYAEFLMQQYPV